MGFWDILSMSMAKENYNMGPFKTEYTDQFSFKKGPFFDISHSNSSWYLIPKFSAKNWDS